MSDILVPKVKMKNGTYDSLSWWTQIGIPGLATLYFALSAAPSDC